MTILSMSWFKLEKVSFAVIKFLGFYTWFSQSRSMMMPCCRDFFITLVYTTLLIFMVFCSYSGQNVQKKRNRIWYVFIVSRISIWQAEIIWSLSTPHTNTHTQSLYELNFANQADGDPIKGTGLPTSSSWLSNIYFNTLQWLSKLLLGFIIFSEVLSIHGHFSRSCFTSSTLCIFSSFSLPDLFSSLFSPVLCHSRLNIITVLSDVYFLNLAE